MNHPDRETRIAYLYRDGLTAEQRAGLEAHLAACTECAAEQNSWRRVQSQLDSWRLPRHRRPTPSALVHFGRFAAAAAILITSGLALGRYAFPDERHPVALRNELREEFNHQLATATAEIQATSQAQIQELLTEFARLQERRRQADLAAVQSSLRQLDAQQRTDSAALRRDLETVAVITDASFRETQDRMFQLASFPRDNTTPNSTNP